MKLLHTSDLHLGKSLLEESLIEDQKYILNEIIKIIKEENIDALLIPGDIYDKNIPSVDAVNLFNDFLFELSNLKIDTFITSGNHDSNIRLGFGKELFNKLNIHIVTEFNGVIEKYEYKDTDIYLLPYIKPFNIKQFINEDIEINNSNEMMKYLLNNLTLNKDKKNIILLHQFVMNNNEDLEFSDSESQVVGTLDSIDVNLFKDFDYVAMGHIHRPQKVKHDYIRYSGTPLKYSFSEANDKKSVVIFDTKDNSIELKELNPSRILRVVKGTLQEILKLEQSNDLIKVELLDKDNLISPMEQIKRKFPNALSLSFINKEVNTNSGLDGETTLKKDITVDELFNNFFKYQNDRELTSDELNYLNNIINDIEGEQQ